MDVAIFRPKSIHPTNVKSYGLRWFVKKQTDSR
jgi:hypothetical protein